MNSRKGLKRYGMRSWIVEGPRGHFVIERERRRNFALRRASMPPGFFMEKFKLLGAARAVAEAYAGVT